MEPTRKDADSNQLKYKGHCLTTFDMIYIDRIYVNNEPFDEKPESCATCPFFVDGSSSMRHSDKDLCMLFGVQHKRHHSPPARCQKIFTRLSNLQKGQD